jgi:hypothetical protein
MDPIVLVAAAASVISAGLAVVLFVLPLRARVTALESSLAVAQVPIGETKEKLSAEAKFYSKNRALYAPGAYYGLGDTLLGSFGPNSSLEENRPKGGFYLKVFGENTKVQVKPIPGGCLLTTEKNVFYVGEGEFVDLEFFGDQDRIPY